MQSWNKLWIGVAGSLIALGGVGWVGLQLAPQNFPVPTTKSAALGTVAVPAALPAPVRRYFEVAFGERVPRVESVVAWGRARAKFGIWMPLRFLLYHRPGYDFRRAMEVTWFGLPVLKAMDQFINGKGMTGPVGNADTGPEVDQGSNMILWAEATFYPSLLLTDRRIRWEAIDETRARLHFPFGEQEDELVFHFDPQTGLVSRTSALRYQGNTGKKVPWYAEIQEWQTINGMKLPLEVSVVWENQPGPWSYWRFEHILWNVDISQQLPMTPLSFIEQRQHAVLLNGGGKQWPPNR